MKIKNKFRKIFYAVAAAFLLIPVTFTSAASFIQCEGVDCGINDIIETVGSLITFILELSIGATSLLFAWAGVMYMTSGGDSSEVAKAKKMFKNGAVRLIIVLTAFLVIELIVRPLGVDESIIKLVK